MYDLEENPDMWKEKKESLEISKLYTFTKLIETVADINVVPIVTLHPGTNFYFGLGVHLPTTLYFDCIETSDLLEL